MNSSIGILPVVWVMLIAIACAGQSPSPTQLAAPTAARLPTRTVESTPAPQTLTLEQPSQESATDAVSVSYSSEGFLPKRIDIEPGQRVRFVNESDKSFWPASNIHPTHEIYPEFDAGEPIRPGEVWTFQFEGPGFWRYHNHLGPGDSGLVVVKGEPIGDGPEPLVMNPQDFAFTEPRGISVQDGIDLFNDDNLLASFLEEYGPAHTVALLADNASQVGINCHERAHDMGRISYKMFGAVAFALAGHECQAGAYHGAIEVLFRERGTINIQGDIEVLCGDLNRFFRHQCIHGVGHGLMAWTSYELLDALPLCDRFQAETDQLSCYSGIFMENVVGGLSGTMGHFTEYLSDDAHFPCNVVEEKYVAPCYFYQSSRAIVLFESDFAQVAQFCAEAPAYAQRECFSSMGRDVGGVTRGDPARAIELCAHADEGNNRVTCLKGAVQDRFWEIRGADEALSFCRMLQDEGEKSACYWSITTRAKQLYETPAGLQEFCAGVEERYRDWCR